MKFGARYPKDHPDKVPLKLDGDNVLNGQLKTCQLRMHRNVRQPDTVQSRICFNFVARAKFEVPQPIHCRLRALLLLIRYITL